MQNPSDVGLRLLVARRERKLSQGQLAAASGIRQQHISAVERGSSPLWPSWRERLATVGIDIQ